MFTVALDACALVPITLCDALLPSSPSISRTSRPGRWPPWEIEVVHPDTFLLNQLDLAPGHVTTAIRAVLAAYKRPPRTTQELLGSLARSGVPDFADELRRHLPEM